MTDTTPSTAQYEQVVSALVNAVPDLHLPDDKDPHGFSWRPITLEHVLRACAEKVNDIALAGSGKGVFIYKYPENEKCGFWHLGKPLSEQTPECIAFLHSLLSS